MIFWTLITVVALAPLPLGAVYAWTWGLMGCVVGVLLVAWSVMVVLGKAPAGVSVRATALVLVPFGLAAAWAVLQTSPITPSGWHHPLWRSTAEALGVDVAGAVSLDPFETGSAVFRLLTYAGIFWLALQYCRDRARARQAFYALAAAGLAYAIYGLIIAFTGVEMILWFDKTAYRGHLTSTFVNRNSYATYAGLTLVCASGLLVRLLSEAAGPDIERRENVRALLETVFGRGWVFLVALAAIPTAMLLTHSRGGFASTTIGLIVFFIAVGATRTMTFRHAAALACVVFAAGALFVLMSGEGTAGRLADAAIDIEGRFGMNALTLQAIGDAPLVGTGYGTFEDAFRLYRDETLPGSFRFNMAHNTYLENALELGLPAAIALFSAIGGLLVICILGVRRRRRDAIYPCIGVAATVLVAAHSLVDFSLQIPAVAVTYSLIMGTACAQSWSSREKV